MAGFGWPPRQLVRLGYRHNKARALIELSQAISEGRFEPNSFEQASDRDVLASLQHLRGIGRWTAEYALLRGRGRTNVSRATTSVLATIWNSGWVCATPSRMPPLSAYSGNLPLQWAHLLSSAAGPPRILGIPKPALIIR
jgi:hypothetical protein